VEAAMAQVVAAASLAAAGVGVDDAASSVSQEMARQWPGLPESRWVAGLWSLSSSAAGVVGMDVCFRGPGAGRRRRRLKQLLSRASLDVWGALVSYGSPLVWAMVVYLYSLYVQGWLASLSTLGRGLVAVAVVGGLSLGVVAWRIRQRWSSRSPRVDGRVEEGSVRHDDFVVGRTDVEVGGAGQLSVVEVASCPPYLSPTVTGEGEEGAATDRAVPQETDNVAVAATIASSLSSLSLVSLTVSSLAASDDDSWHFSDSSRSPSPSSLSSSGSNDNSVSFGSFDLNETSVSDSNGSGNGHDGRGAE
jgi:hypothetical protein